MTFDGADLNEAIYQTIELMTSCGDPQDYELLREHLKVLLKARELAAGSVAGEETQQVAKEDWRIQRVNALENLIDIRTQEIADTENSRVPYIRSMAKELIKERDKYIAERNALIASKVANENDSH